MLFDKPQPVRFTSGFPGLPEGKPSGQSRREQARAFKAALRRRAQLRAAAEVLPRLPGPGESLHALLTGTLAREFRCLIPPGKALEEAVTLLFQAAEAGKAAVANQDG